MAETHGVQLRDLGVCACPCHPVQGNLRWGAVGSAEA